MDSEIVLVGPPAPCRFIRPVPERPCLLGRSSQCDLIVDDPSVSRWHARLSLRGTLVQVADLGSRNGTFVDDEPVREAEVACGRRLRFGDVAFQLTTRDRLTDELAGALGVGETPAGHRQSPLTPAARLTRAQREVFDLMAQGLSEKAIARRLKVSAHTVHAHVCAIYKSFQVHSRSELLAQVFRMRVVAVVHDAGPPDGGNRPAGPVLGERPVTAIRLFYLSTAERDDYQRILGGLGIPFRDAGGSLHVDGPVTHSAMRAVTAALRTNHWLG